MPRKTKLRLAVPVLLGAVSLPMLGFAITSSAQADSLPPDKICHYQSWSDGTTWGAHCQKGFTGQVRAVVLCENGQHVYGQYVSDDQSSYGYCSSVGSTVHHGRME